MHPLDAAVTAAQQTITDQELTALPDQELRTILSTGIAAAFDVEAQKIRADVERAEATDSSPTVRECGPMLGDVLERAGQLYREGDR